MGMLAYLFVETRVDGFSLWIILLLCCGVFLAAFMDAIAGGGGIISQGVEKTTDNVGRLGKIGMRSTDKEILQIMLQT